MLSLTLVALISSCECVPEINTPKVINPENFSYVRLINALPDHSEIKAESNEIEISVSSYNNDNSPQIYSKFQAGNTFSRIISVSRNQVIANHLFLLAKEEYYTLAVFGRGSIARTLLITDIIPSYKSGYSNIRLFNFLNGTNGLIYKNQSLGINEAVNFGGHTDFLSIPLGMHEIEIYDTNDQLIGTFELNTETGSSYDLICQGILNNQPQSINLRIIEIIK